jgi:hypothetical protein
VGLIDGGRGGSDKGKENGEEILIHVQVVGMATNGVLSSLVSWGWVLTYWIKSISLK